MYKIININNKIKKPYKTLHETHVTIGQHSPYSSHYYNMLQSQDSTIPVGKTSSLRPLEGKSLGNRVGRAVTEKTQFLDLAR